MSNGGDFWSGEAPEVTVRLTELLEELRMFPGPQLVERAISIAEDAMHIGLPDVAAGILTICRLTVDGLPTEDAQPRLGARLDNVTGLLALRRGEVAEAVELLQRAAELGRSTQDPLEEALAYQNLAGAMWLQGDLEASRRLARSALEIYEQRDDRYRQAQMLISLANYELDDGAVSSALALLDRAEQLIARRRWATPLRLSIIGTRALAATAIGDHLRAGELHRQAYQIARQRGDLSYLRITHQNLGNWYSESGKALLAARHLGEASRLAALEGNVSLQSQLLRAQALQLHRGRRRKAGLETMRLSSEISRAAGDRRGLAEAQADLAALMLDESYRAEGETRGDEPVDRSEIRALLDVALIEFTDLGDPGWTVRILGNRASLSLLEGDPDSAVSDLAQARHATGFQEVGARIELDRRAAAIALNDLRDPIRSAAFVRSAAEEMASAPPEVPIEVNAALLGPPGIAAVTPAWELACGAALMREKEFAVQQAAQLFEEARSSAASDPSLTFHIVNDLGSTYAQLNDFVKARQSFDECLMLAERLNDRVMSQQALANKAETARRQGDPEAPALFREAVTLAVDLDDTEALADTLLNLATWHVDESQPDAAEQILRQVTDLVPTDSKTISRMSAISGNVAWFRGEFDEAVVSYLSAAASSSGVQHIENLAAALEVLAQTGNREVFRRQAQRFLRAAQRQELDGVAGLLLIPSARRWVSIGNQRMAARTFAWAIELEMVQWIHDQPPRRHGVRGGDSVELSDSEAGFAIPVDLLTVLGQMGAASSTIVPGHHRMVDNVRQLMIRELPPELHDFIGIVMEQVMVAADEFRSQDSS